MKQRIMLFINLLLIIALSMATLSCGSSNAGGTQLADLSGVWKGSECECEIIIDLANDTKSMIIEDQKMAVSVKGVVDGVLSLNVNDGNGKTDEWKLIQRWDDNGSTFSLALIRNGKKESLSLVKKL